MYGFYMFEGSCDVGAGVGAWGDIEIRNNLPEIQRAAFDYIRTGNWEPELIFSNDKFLIRVYQRGEVVREVDLYPFLRVKIHGVTEMTFGVEIQGGEPEPDSLYAGLDEDTFWQELGVDFSEDRPDCLNVTIDWQRAALPALQSPVLPEGARVDTDEYGELSYGSNTTYSPVTDPPADEHARPFETAARSRGRRLGLTGDGGASTPQRRSRRTSFEPHDLGLGRPGEHS